MLCIAAYTNVVDTLVSIFFPLLYLPIHPVGGVFFFLQLPLTDFFAGHLCLKVKSVAVTA